MTNASTNAIKLTLLAASVLFAGCDKNDRSTANTAIALKASSVTPSLVTAMPGFKNVQFFPLISSADKLPGSPSFVYGAQPDGAGLMKDPGSDGYIMVTNHANLFAVSRVYLDKTLTPVRGEYIANGKAGITQLCSATLATPEENGFPFPVFLAAGKTTAGGAVEAINPLGLVSDRGWCGRTLKALGNVSMKNAVPLPKETYPGKTVILIGEDQPYTAMHSSAGQLIMYVSNVCGDLQSGDLYTLRRTDNNQVETDITKGNSYEVEFVKLPDIREKSCTEIDTIVNDLKAIRFSRVEDIDYRKGSASNGREIYFAAAGQSAADKATPQPGYTMWGRIYKLVMKEADFTKGRLELVAEGDSRPGADLIGPDNLCVTENFVYIQENGGSYYKEAKHDSYIWQFNIGTKSYKPFINMDHHRDHTVWNMKFNQAGVMNNGSWAYGAMHDISDVTGVPNTFLLNIHPHTWQSNDFLNADGSGVSRTQEGGETVILSGVQR